VDEVAKLQKERQIRTSHQPDAIQFHDRSVVCTAALAVYLSFPLSEFLTSELGRIKMENIYEKRVFFIRNLGFITPSDARRISFDETVRFEQIHAETYLRFGFELVSIEPASVPQRVSAIKSAIS